MYALASRKMPNSAAKCRLISGWVVIRQADTRNTAVISISITTRVNKPRYLPSTISLILMGEEYNNFMVPALTSRLMMPMVSKGMNRNILAATLRSTVPVSSPVNPVPSKPVQWGSASINTFCTR